MSAFSRGCSMRRQFLRTKLTSHFFPTSLSFQQPRLLSSTSILRAATKVAPKTALKQALPKSKSSFTPTKSPVAAQPGVYQSYASKLALKPHPTLLYQAPSHTGFIIGSYLGAATCFGYAIYFFWGFYLNPPEDIASWIPIAFGGAAFIMAAAGGYFLLGPAWIVKSITAMPQSALKAAGAITKGVAPGEMRIEVALRKMFPIPFIPARKLYLKPDEIQLEHQLARVDLKLTTAELRAIKIAEAEEAQKALEYEQTHIMSKGPRIIGRIISKSSFDIFKAVRRTWTQEGFTNLRIKRYNYKLDVSGGWALEGGRALDRLVTVKQKV